MPVATTRVEPGSTSTPSVWMYGAADGEVMACLRPDVKSVDESAETFEVYAADGGQVGKIHYEHWRLWPRRYRWVVRLADGGKVDGGVGTWYSWALSIGLFPVWGPLLLAVFVGAWLQGDGDTWESFGGPSRIRWFRRGKRGWAMSHGTGSAYRLRPELMDFRIAYALGLASAWNGVARFAQREREVERSPIQ